jgi:alkanesulfonate monooxygenase SsuD/methylene tetrahydromethanopterin reductase-like flavin-dependent oxidoreductase (luciferase family)
MLRRGIALYAGTPAEVIAQTARAAEELGYDSFWLNHPGATDGVAALAAADRATGAIELGVGVVPLHTRPAASVVAGVREHDLPVARLLIGIGSAHAGAYRLAREGAVLIRDELHCRVVMGALGEGACRLARRSAEWVGEGAREAGRPIPKLFSYVRVALGDDAGARIEEEGARYAGGSYRSHFDRMGARPIETAVVASAPGEVSEQLHAWEGVVDEVVLRLLPAAVSVEAHLELLHAGKP